MNSGTYTRDEDGNLTLIERTLSVEEAAALAGAGQAPAEQPAAEPFGDIVAGDAETAEAGNKPKRGGK